MKIAITCENGEVFQHFGREFEFALFNVENGTATFLGTQPLARRGHCAIARWLSEEQVEVVICNGMYEGADNALSEVGIKIISGASGDVNKVAADFAAGTLQVCQKPHTYHHGEPHRPRHCRDCQFFDSEKNECSHHDCDHFKDKN